MGRTKRGFCNRTVMLITDVKSDGGTLQFSILISMACSILNTAKYASAKEEKGTILLSVMLSV